MITQEYLKSILSYDPETGLFLWKISRSNRVKIGSEPGCTTNTGYICIKLDSKKYQAHRLAWLYVYGYMPKNDVDHINGNRIDNRIINLREATRSENIQNLKKCNSNNKTGLLGSCFNKSVNKFQAQIVINYKRIHLGYFNTAIEAHEAYIKAKRELHPYGEL
jgi:hypothetical protein